MAALTLNHLCTHLSPQPLILCSYPLVSTFFLSYPSSCAARFLAQSNWLLFCSSHQSPELGRQWGSPGTNFLRRIFEANSFIFLTSHELTRKQKLWENEDFSRSRTGVLGRYFGKENEQGWEQVLKESEANSELSPWDPSKVGFRCVGNSCQEGTMEL